MNRIGSVHDRNVRRLSRQRSYICLLFASGLYGSSQIFYTIAGQVDQATEFGSQFLYLLISSSLFVLASYLLWAHVVLKPRWGFRLSPVLILIIVTTVRYNLSSNFATILSDQINAVLFFIITFWVIIAICLLRFLKNVTPWMPIFVIACSVVYVAVAAVYGKSHIHNGMFGLPLESNRFCQLPTHVPWVSLFPSRTMNFFSGPHSCPAVKQFSSMVDGYVLFDDDASCRTRKFIFNYNFLMDRSDRQDSNMDRRRATPPKQVEVSEAMIVKIPADTRTIRAFCDDQENYHLVNVAKPDVLKQAALAKQNNKNIPPPNILMLMLDALSRSHFLRKMPLTHAALDELRQPESGFSVFQFLRYATIGHSTSKNLVPMIIGSENNGSNPVWGDFKTKHGFVTATILNQCDDYYQFFGSPNQDLLDHDVGAPEFCHPEYDNWGVWTNFAGPYSLRRRCISGRYVHNHTLDYIDQVFDHYTDNAGKFVAAFFSEAHEGSQEIVATMDENLADFLRSMRDKSHLDDTITFLVSDHGCHMGPYYLYTQAGRLEKTLPLLNVIVPNSFLDRNPGVRESLISNQQRLITCLDIYTTLRHLAHLPDPVPDDMPGLSLLTPISESRTCHDARIPDDECPCIQNAG